jgi:hypothetical protein
MKDENGGRGGRRATALSAAHGLAFAGFVVYAMAAPHSIAGAWMGLSAVTFGWLVRLWATRDAGVRRTPFDLPLLLFVLWTVVSALLSAEPRVSLAKLVSVATCLVFYLTQAMLTRRVGVVTAAVLVASGVAGTLWSLGEVAVGRGVRIVSMADASPFREVEQLGAGDAIWRVNGRRVSSLAEIDAEIGRTPTGERLRLSVVARGEHVEWPGFVVTDEIKYRVSPSGLVGAGRTHRFRASGWTRHYETYAEMLQMTAQLALGFALAALLRNRRGASAAVWLPAAAFALLGVGVALTAMRTSLMAFAVGAIVVAWRAAPRGRARALVVGGIAGALALGALVVLRTRASGALTLGDPSASLRYRVARVALGRVPEHPVFGHGMDAVHLHWQEWGFPGTDMLHAHSTPIQLAFDRGLPALLFWLWLLAAFLAAASRAERLWRDAADAGAHGLALGAAGALAGFAASSLVNYNFGDAEVALLLWWLMGAVVVLTRDRDDKVAA